MTLNAMKVHQEQQSQITPIANLRSFLQDRKKEKGRKGEREKGRKKNINCFNQKKN